MIFDLHLEHEVSREEQQMPLPENSAVVVAHGAWADGSSWNEVILPLSKQGLQVVAAPLPLTSLSDDITALNRTIARTQGPVIVAGHAYAGAVIAGANEDRVKALIYVAALAPDEGETVAEVFYRDEAHPQAPKLAPDKDGWIWMPEEGFANALRASRHGRSNCIMQSSAATDRTQVHPGASSEARVEIKAVLVSDRGRRPHDQSKDAAIYGSSNGREGPLEPRGP